MVTLEICNVRNRPADPPLLFAHAPVLLTELVWSLMKKIKLQSAGIRREKFGLGVVQHVGTTHGRGTNFVRSARLMAHSLRHVGEMLSALVAGLDDGRLMSERRPKLDQSD
jgi:hypothetical protein